MKILGLALLLTFNTLKAETIRLPIEFGQSKALTFDTNIKNDEIGSQIKSLGGSFSSAEGHRANAAIGLSKSDGILNYTHKNSNRSITFDTNISSDRTSERTMPQINSVGGGFTGSSGHGVSAILNTTGSGGAINYTHTNNRTKLKFTSGVNVTNGIHGVNIGVQLPLGTK